MEMIHLQLQIFILLGIGYLLGKKGIFTKTTTSQINWLIMNLVLPCAIFRAFDMEVNIDILKSTVVVLILSVIIQVVSIAAAKLLWRKVKNDNIRTNLDYGTVANNAGTLGMVVAEAAFGSEGLLFSSIYMMPVRILMWSYGIALYSKENAGKKGGLVKVLLHPCLIAIYLGVIYMFASNTGFALPGFATRTINALANCNTALVMLVIGTILSELSIKEVANKWTILYSIVRLIVFPGLIFLSIHFLPLPALAAEICIIETAMPAPVTMAMLAQKYNKDEKFASSMIFVSTLGSMITLPIWTFLCMM